MNQNQLGMWFTELKIRLSPRKTSSIAWSLMLLEELWVENGFRASVQTSCGINQKLRPLKECSLAYLNFLTTNILTHRDGVSHHPYFIFPSSKKRYIRNSET